MENEKEEYFLKIRDSILKNPQLNSSDKIILGLIDNLQNQTGFCWATNESIANITGISLVNTQRIVKKLIKLGLVEKVSNHKKNGGIERILSTKNIKPDNVSDAFADNRNSRVKELFDYDWLNEE